MELRVLRYFLMVAQEENITKAAALLHFDSANAVQAAETIGRGTGCAVVSPQQA